MARQGLAIALLAAAMCCSTPVHSVRLKHQQEMTSLFSQPPASSARFMQTHEALLRNALKKADSESLVQLDKEGGVDYVLCAKTARHGQPRSDAHAAASTAVIAPLAAFLPEATVTFASEEDRSVIFKKLIAPKTFVSSQCSFGTHHQLFYGEVKSAEMLSGPTPAVKISVAWASPQQVCGCILRCAFKLAVFDVVLVRCACKPRLNKKLCRVSFSDAILVFHERRRTLIGRWPVHNVCEWLPV